MTNEEAIDIIKKYDTNSCGYCHQGGDEVEEAFNMAIKALELVDKLDSEDGFTYRVVYQMGYNEGIREAMKKMTLERLIGQFKAYTEYPNQDTFVISNQECKDILKYLTEQKSFIEWVASEIFDDDWEFNNDAFAEIACRKLVKLGIVKEVDGEYIFERE